MRSSSIMREIVAYKVYNTFPMSRLVQLYRSTPGRKAVVAVTGIVLFGFVTLHMLGNLKMFGGADARGIPHIDAYARFLRTMGDPLLPRGAALWTMRVILLAAVLLHVYTSIGLAAINRAARPVRYERYVPVQSTVAARSMLATGLLVLAFAVLHILHFTTGTIRITPFEPEHVYANVHGSFRVWFIAAFYVAAVAALGMHLYHGVWSLFQTLGLDNPDRNRGFRALAAASAIIVFLGFASVPVLVFVGALPQPPGAAAR